MKTYLKFLSRNKFYTAIEAAGLAVSLAFVILIGCYAWQQYAITREHPDRDRLYVLGMPDYYGLTRGFRQSAEGRIPEIEQIVQVMSPMGVVFTVGGTPVQTETIAADPEFFELFPYYRLLEGSADALRSKTGLLASARFARAHDLHPGSEIRYGEEVYTVGGIVEDFDNTLFRATDLILPMSSELVMEWGGALFDNYGSFVPFVRLRADADFDAFFEKAEALCKEIYPNMYGMMFFEYLRAVRIDRVFFDSPANRDHPLFRRGDWQTLRILIAVGLLLLLSAIFNYINLSTALSGRRAKEMATRRLLGASRGAIAGKYIAESIGFTALCFGFGLLLAYAFAPTFNTLLNDPAIAMQVRITPPVALGFLLLIAVTGTLSGALPASLAARFKPVDVVKGTYRRVNKMTFSKVFIVLQSALAIFLLAMALVMELQYAHSFDRPMHADIAGKFLLGPISGKEGNSFADHCRTLPFVQRIGLTQGAPGWVPGGQFSTTRTGEEILYRTYKMDSTAFAMLRFEKVRDFGAPPGGSIWFGERAFAASGFDDDFYDISQTLALRMSNVGEVAGTYVDFSMNPNNMGEEEYALVQVLDNAVLPRYWFCLLIETSGDPAAAKRALIDAYREWTETNAGLAIEPTTADYLEDLFAEGMRPARNNMRLLELFLALAMLISILGLVAMSTYYAGVQAKSIAIRKVFGGTVESETRKSVCGYMLLVGIACLLALPAAVWAADRYLEEYIYRIERYGWVFAAAVALSAAVAFLSVIGQTLRAARTDPAAELKKE